MKSAKFQKNIHKRGAVPETTIKKGGNYPVGPLVLGLFIFVVIGSGKKWEVCNIEILVSVMELKLSNAIQYSSSTIITMEKLFKEYDIWETNVTKKL